MQTEYTSDILLNRTLKYKLAIVRVDNDEYAYYLQTARAERSLLHKAYFRLDAERIRRHTSRVLSSADILWFISQDELSRYRRQYGNKACPRTEFVPAAVDLSLMERPPLEGFKVLFVGNLWTPLNKQAVEWYVQNVHPRLSDVPGYNLAIAGSCRDDCDWLRILVSSFTNISVSLNLDDLSGLYRTSAVFINPMQQGSGVKLKTIEAVLRGLPVVSTRIGAEGSGLMDGLHFKCGNTPSEFAEGVRTLLYNRELAKELVRCSQDFLIEHYDQGKVLERLSRELTGKPLGKADFRNA
jgi:glycosyltransferase involved in cell wall biosynthesis